MDKQFSVEESFAVIKQVIVEARMRFQQNGWLFIFWGLVIAAVSFTNYFLLKAGVRKPYLINWVYVVAAIITFVYFSFKYKRVKTNNVLVNLLGWMWLVININIFVIGFGFHNLGFISVFVIMLIVSLGYFVGSLMIRSWILVLGALVMNISAYIILFLKTFEQLLLLIGFVALICIFIPGVLMEIKKRM